MSSEALLSSVVPFAGSGLLGYAMGFALKKILKWMLIVVGFIVGMFFVGVQPLQGYVCAVLTGINLAMILQDDVFASAESLINHVILNGYRRIMYKKVSITIIMASAIAAILIVPWAALQRSYAQSDFANTILKIHNDERAAVGSPALKWSDSLAAGAKTWADHLATTGMFDHCFNVAPPTCDLSHVGENLAASASHDPTLGSPSNTIKMQQDWVNEKNKWNGSPVTSENMYPIGHYVQMVSPATTAVGCATASGTQNSVWDPPWNGPWDVLVCRYDRNQNGQPYIAPFLSRGK